MLSVWNNRKTTFFKIFSPKLHSNASKNLADTLLPEFEIMKRCLFTQFIATVLILMLGLPMFAFAVPTSNAKPLTDDQRILHVLNRLGFGARPGDVEKVRAIGLQKYIQMQLNPSSIPDDAVEAKLSDLEVYQLSTPEVFAKYPNPGALLRSIEGKNKRAQVANAEPAKEPTSDDKKGRQAKLRELYREYDLKPATQILAQVNANRVLRAVYSERQLQEVMVDFWQNHFNVYAGKGAVRWYIPSYERDVLRKNAIGNFKDLLIGTAQHPAMLFFLDNFQSVADKNDRDTNQKQSRFQQMMTSGNIPPQMRERMKRNQGLTDAEIDQRIERAKTNAAKGQTRQKRGINENYARELMELHTLGVDGGYTQQDIIEVAKAFTGWTIADPRGYRNIAGNMIKGTEDKKLDRLRRRAGVPNDIESGEFYFNEKIHDESVKTILGQEVHEGGIKDGLKVIDMLVKSPATAKFIARKLAVKFVSDDPSETLIDRVAAAFSKSGGDIKATLSTLFSDPEFYAPENYRAKIKTPFELAASSIRAIGADTNAGPAMTAMLNKLGEVPYGYQAPTGYPDKAEDWVNTGALLERLNYSVALASNQIPGTHVDLQRFAAPTQAAVLDNALAVVLSGEVSANTRTMLEKQIVQPLPKVEAPAATEDEDPGQMAEMNPRQRAQKRRTKLLPPSGDPDIFKVVSLVLGTPEFQRQ